MKRGLLLGCGLLLVLGLALFLPRPASSGPNLNPIPRLQLYVSVCGGEDLAGVPVTFTVMRNGLSIESPTTLVTGADGYVEFMPGKHLILDDRCWVSLTPGGSSDPNAVEFATYRVGVRDDLLIWKPTTNPGGEPCLGNPCCPVLDDESRGGQGVWKIYFPEP